MREQVQLRTAKDGLTILAQKLSLLVDLHPRYAPHSILRISPPPIVDFFVRFVPAYCKIGNVPRTAFGYAAYYLRGCTCIHNLVVFPIPCPTNHVLTYAQGNGARIMETCKIILTYEQILSTPK